MGFCSSNQRRRRRNDFIVRLNLVGMYFHILRNRIQITGKYMIYFILKNLLSRFSYPRAHYKQKEHKCRCISSYNYFTSYFTHFNIFFISSFNRECIIFIDIHGPRGGNICNAPRHRGKKLQEVRSGSGPGKNSSNCPEKTCNKLHSK